MSWQAQDHGWQRHPSDNSYVQGIRERRAEPVGIKAGVSDTRVNLTLRKTTGDKRTSYRQVKPIERSAHRRVSSKTASAHPAGAVLTFVRDTGEPPRQD